SRGAEHWVTGPDPVAESLGMHGVISAGVKNENEGLYPVQHGYWLETMRAALARESTNAMERGRYDHHRKHKHRKQTDHPERDRAVSLPRGPVPRRPRVREVAGVLRRRRRLLDAVVGRQRPF